MMKGGDVKAGIIYPVTPGVSHGASQASSLCNLKKNQSGSTVTEWTGNSVLPTNITIYRRS